MLWGKNEKLAVAVTCSDWRLHQRAVDFNTRIGKAVGCGRVDMVVLPGPDGLLLPKRVGEWEAALSQVGLLADAHKAVALAVVAHERCAGHPVTDPEHLVDVVAAAKALKGALGFSGPAYALIATYRSDTDWGLDQVGRA
ncbi:MAG TPA: carbonic anhydrase [Rhizomicrobium sp.]|nr:carbonic anhydrase [Rhizomicrobium sp.]